MRVEPSWRQPAGSLLILLLIAGWASCVASVGAADRRRAALGPDALLSGRRDRLDPAAEAAAALDGDRPLARLMTARAARRPKSECASLSRRPVPGRRSTACRTRRITRSIRSDPQAARRSAFDFPHPDRSRPQIPRRAGAQRRARNVVSSISQSAGRRAIPARCWSRRMKIDIHDIADSRCLTARWRARRWSAPSPARGCGRHACLRDGSRARAGRLD